MNEPLYLRSSTYNKQIRKHVDGDEADGREGGSKHRRELRFTTLSVKNLHLWHSGTRKERMDTKTNTTIVEI